MCPVKEVIQFVSISYSVIQVILSSICCLVNMVIIVSYAVRKLLNFYKANITGWLIQNGQSKKL